MLIIHLCARSLFTVLAVLLVTPLVADADWERFRGPSGSGITEEKNLPVRWSESENVLWKTALPGPGSSSPIISNGRILLTAYSGYGDGGSGSMENLRRHVVCIDAKTGKLIWDKSIKSRQPEQAFRGIGMPHHGYASSTPVADGKSVFAFFGITGVISYDFAGKELWRAPVASNPRTHMFGSASSLVLVDDLVIVPAGIECEAIIAFDKKTGKEAWRAPAEGYGSWWGTPLLIDDAGRKSLLISVPYEVWSLNPGNGKLRWYAESFEDRNIIPSVVVSKGVAYAIGGRGGGAAAVKIGGRGDVTKTNVLWRGSQGSYVTSPVVHQDQLYWVNDRGVLYCVNTTTGETDYQKRLEGAGGVYASLLVADGTFYAVSRRNGTVVFEVKPEFKVIAHNKIASDGTDFNASPAVHDGRLYLRSNRFLYCLTKKD